MAKDQIPKDPLSFGLPVDKNTKTKPDLALSQIAYYYSVNNDGFVITESWNRRALIFGSFLKTATISRLNHFLNDCCGGST